MEDRRLVEQAQHGSREAFEAIVKRYERKVFHLAYGFVQDRGSADDLAQEVFIKAYFSISKFRFKSEFGTWLYRIAVNHIKDYLRKASRKREVSLEEIKEIPAAVTDPIKEKEAEHMEDKKRKIIFRMLETLPQKYRTILTLRDVRGLPYEEIAGVLKISPGTVDSRLYRARRMLRGKLTPYLGGEGEGHEV